MTARSYVTIWCDCRNTLGPQASACGAFLETSEHGKRAARRAARDNGWVWRDGLDLAPAYEIEGHSEVRRGNHRAMMAGNHPQEDR